MTLRAIVARVAHRFRARDRGDAIELLLADGGALSVGDVARRLSRRLGPVSDLRFDTAGLMTVPSMRVAIVRGLDAAGTPVAGTVTCRTTIEYDQLVTWVELELGGAAASRSRTVEAAPFPRQLVDDRLRRVGDLLRRVITKVRVNPSMPGHAFAAELAEIIEIAECRAGDERG